MFGNSTSKRLFATFEMIGMIVIILILIALSLTYLSETSASDDSLRKKVAQMDNEFEGVKYKIDEWEEMQSENVDVGKDEDNNDNEDNAEDGTDDNQNETNEENFEEGDEGNDGEEKEEEELDASAEITAEGLNVRASASTNAEVVDVLGTGDVVELTGENGEGDGYNWSEVVLPNGNTGWVVSDYIK